MATGLGSDCLVIEARLTRQTHHLFDESQLRRMKPTAILINTARGPIVADRALHRALTGQAPLSPVNAGELVEARWSRSR